MVALLFKVLFLILLTSLCDWSFMTLPKNYFFFFLINCDFVLVSSLWSWRAQGNLVDWFTLMSNLKCFRHVFWSVCFGSLLRILKLERSHLQFLFGSYSIIFLFYLLSPLALESFAALNTTSIFSCKGFILLEMAIGRNCVLLFDISVATFFV